MKLGDRVFVFRRGYRDGDAWKLYDEATITKAGKKYLTATIGAGVSHQPKQYSADTGLEKSEYSKQWRIVSDPKEIELESEANELRSKIRAAIAYSNRLNTIPLEQLRVVWASLGQDS